jgi:hypothetical protein
LIQHTQRKRNRQQRQRQNNDNENDNDGTCKEEQKISGERSQAKKKRRSVNIRPKIQPAPTNPTNPLTTAAVVTIEAIVVAA